MSGGCQYYGGGVCHRETVPPPRDNFGVTYCAQHQRQMESERRSMQWFTLMALVLILGMVGTIVTVLARGW